MITLRPYQETWVDGLRQSLRAGHNSVLGVLQTGAGKTVCFSYLTGRLTTAKRRPLRVVLMVHRDELVDQISATLDQFDVPQGRICSGYHYDPRMWAQVASVLSLVNRLDQVEVPDYVIVDEAHHSLAPTWRKVFAYWRAKNPLLRIIGVTATPELLSGAGLGDEYEDMVIGPEDAELVAVGALSRFRIFAPAQPVDLSDVDVRSREFVKGAAAFVMDKPAIVGDTISNYRKYLDGAPTISFEVSVQNAERMAARFRDAGYTAVSLDSKMEKNMRRAIVREFARGAINVLTSCDLVSEGFDVPRVVGGIFRRPTWSLALYRQQAGRPRRPFAGKDFSILLDQVGNSARHGMPDAPVEWSLEGRAGARRSKATEAACRQCPMCYAVSPAAAVKCRECDEVFPITPREVEEIEGELAEIETARKKRDARAEQGMAKSFEELVAIGRARGHKNPAAWARNVLIGRQAKRSHA